MKILGKNIIGSLFLKMTSLAALILSVVSIFTVIYEFGFPVDEALQAKIRYGNKLILILFWVVVTVRIFLLGSIGKSTVNSMFHYLGYGFFTAVSLMLLAVGYGLIQADSFINIATSNFVVVIIILAVSFTEISYAITRVLNSHANPATILTGSFALIILIGSLLLMLPNCNNGLEYIDALFLSASATCVTGLTPVDITQSLTTYGMIVLLLLIQIGGLGIMTITSFFGLFFASGGSLSSQIMVSELLSGNSLSGLLRAIFKVIAVTLFIEAIGAIAIYLSVIDIKEIDNHFMFAVFHAISGFCNAGFSTLSGNLYDPIIRNVGSVMYILSFLVIFGGIGFPIFSNFLWVVWHTVRNIVRRIFRMRPIYVHRLWSLNTYIVVRLTVLLLAVSWALFLILEWNHSLAEFSFWDKLAQGFMMAVTPRTAGFVGVDMMKMMPASVLITIALMWIGGAPQSTAGGVKVTTVYLSFKNILSSTIPGRNIEVYNRSIPNYSVRRAFTVITLSLFVIAVAVFLLSIFEPDIEISKLIFEAVSAIGTVGLSLNVTPHLETESKVIIILLMYIGRVGAVTLMATFFKRNLVKLYKYPEEDILIN